MARLVFQSAGGALFEPGVTYDSYSDTFTGTFALSQTAVTDLQTAATGHADVQGFWQNIAVYLDATMGLSNMSATETTWISDAVTATASGAFTWADVTGWLVRQDATGTAGDDAINGSRWDDYIDGSSGNDTLTGNDGDDYLVGSAGDDTLSGGAGNDILYGGDGSDTFLYEGGNDVVVAVSNQNYAATDTDVIEFAAGITTADVRLIAARTDVPAANLYLEVAGHGTVSIQGWNSVGDVLDQVHFSDSTVYNLNDMDVFVYGTSGDDSLGIVLSDTSRHIFDAGAGNDTINGSSADDTIIFSAGTDVIRGDDGHDILSLPDGYTLADVSFIRTDLGGTYTGLNDAQIVVNGLGTVNLMDHFFWTKTADLRTADELLFADGSSLAIGDQVFVVHGTAGDDYFTGNGSTWLQDDVYMFGTGVDYLYDQGGTDTLRFEAGITPGDISVYRTKYSGSTTYEDLIFEDGAGNSFAVLDQFKNGAVSAQALEFAEFDDGTVWDLFNMEIETRGTSGTDTITSFDYGDLSANDTIFVYEGNDTVYGGNGADLIYGGVGNDYIRGDADNDTLYGDDGDDDVRGDAGDDTMYGGAGNDLLIGYDGNDILDGGDGDDQLSGGTGDDIYLFSAGLDKLYEQSGTADKIVLPDGVLAGDVNVYNAGVDDLLIVVNAAVVSGTLYIQDQRNIYQTKAVESLELFDGTALSLTGTNPANVLYGTPNNDALHGDQDTDLNDTIYGLAGNDVLYGYSGHDVIHGEGGNDSLYGGTGDDEYIFNPGDGQDTINDEDGTTDIIRFGAGITASDVVLTDAGAYDLEITLTNSPADKITILNQRDDAGTNQIEKIIFDDGSELNLVMNVIDGTSGDDTIVGTADADLINGFEGNDTLYGEAGNDELYGGVGDDILEGGSGDDALDGGDGFDTAWYADAASGVIVDLSAGTATGGGNDTLINIEKVIGSNFGDDTLMGGDLNNELWAGNGNDTLYGGAGNDTLIGGANDDFLEGGAGDDVLEGGSGYDTVSYASAAAGVTVNLTYETASGDGNDTVYNMEAIVGSSYDDTLTGNNADNIMNGDAGDDYFSSGNGNDTLYGGAGNDTLIGGANDDVLYGGAGDDILEGGSSYDTVIYADSVAGVTVNLATGTATGDGNDTLYHIEAATGSDFDDTIIGSSANNTLTGGAGSDSLTGGNGADTFMFLSGMVSEVDTISDFSTPQGDAIDISDVLFGYDPLTDAITDFVQITDDGTDSMLAVDADGGADNFVTIATLTGVTGLTDEAALLNSGNLLAT